MKGKKLFQKIIVFLVVLNLIFGFNFNISLLNPRPVRASVVPAVPTVDPSNFFANLWRNIKETGLDTIGWVISQTVLKRLEKRIIDWGMGRKSDSNEPFMITDWNDYFHQAINRGAAKFVEEFDQADIAPGIKSELRKLGIDKYAQDIKTYTEKARSTLKDVLGTKYDDFVKSGYSLSVGGWKGWEAQFEPQNNLWGQYLMAIEEREKMEEQEKEAAQNQAQAAHGYKNETTTIETDIDACKEDCQKKQEDLDLCLASGLGTDMSPACLKDFPEGWSKKKCEEECDMRPGIAIKKRIKNWGQHIEGYMKNAFGADIQKIISTDEISELLGILFSAALNKTIGIGLGPFRVNNTSEIEKRRFESKNRFGYYRDFKKSQTLEDKRDIRSKILNEILGTIKNISESSIPDQCKKLYFQKLHDVESEIDDVLTPSAEALYVGLEGVNLRPDYAVLDPTLAPFPVFGHGYSKIPENKYPPKCKKVIKDLGDNATCKDLKSGLVLLNPKTAINKKDKSIKISVTNPNDDKCSCLFDDDALNCPPSPYPPFSSVDSVKKFQHSKALKIKQTRYNACKMAHNTIYDRCEDCLKKADEKCNQNSEEQKQNCINDKCSNYNGIGIIKNNKIVNLKDIEDENGNKIGGLEFYNRCKIEEQKDNCYTCLREYFMPAKYCQQTADYVARALTKYPVTTLLDRSSFTGDCGMFIGLRIKELMNMGGQCDDNCTYSGTAGRATLPYDLSLICRIMPDFTYQPPDVNDSNGEYNNEGKSYERPPEITCATACKVTKKQLEDITDFKPGFGDCVPRTINVGGAEPFNAISYGAYLVKGKCCAALNGGNFEKYLACIGSNEKKKEEKKECGVDAYTNPKKKPECYCSEGYRPLAIAWLDDHTVYNTTASVATYHSFTVSDDIYNEIKENNDVEVGTSTVPGGATYFISTKDIVPSKGERESISICAKPPKNTTSSINLLKIGPIEPPPIPPTPPSSGVVCQGLSDWVQEKDWGWGAHYCKDPNASPCFEAGDINPLVNSIRNNSSIIWKKTSSRKAQNCTLGADKWHIGNIIKNHKGEKLYFGSYQNKIHDPAFAPEHKFCFRNAKGDMMGYGGICIKCHPDDPGYPTYGTGIDQCNNKQQ